MSAIKSLNLLGVAAVFLGVLTGVFFGPLALGVLNPLANAFSMLLQMAVFPYICLSLVLGIGSIRLKDALALLKRGLLCIGAMWILVSFFVYFLTQLIPTPVPPFVSATAGDQLAFLIEYLVPENGLYALADNQIVAGISLSFLFGIALMKIEKKEFLLPYLKTGIQILERIFQPLCLLSPIGVFLYVSIAFAGLRLEDLAHVEVYLFIRMLFPVFFVVLVLPLIISSSTRLSKIETFKAFRDICLLPFLAGTPILVVPFLICYFRRFENGKILIPVSYCLGQIGVALNFFVLSYLSFYYRLSFSGLEKLAMFFLLAPTSMQDPPTSIDTSFLVDQFHFPVSGVQLHVESAFILHHFLVLLSSASILSILLLSEKPLHIQWKKLAGSIATLAFLFIATVYTVKPQLQIVDYYQGLYQSLHISAVIDHPVRAKIVPPGEGGTPRDPTKSTFSQILETGVLKIGIEVFEIPYSYINDAKELAGYDIAYAHQLARDLDCALEFIVVDRNRIGEQLGSGDYDIGMSSFLMTEDRIKTMAFTNPYQEEENVLIIPRSKLGEFSGFEELQNRELKILARGAYASIAKKYFPNAKIISTNTLFLLENHRVDACLWGRTSGKVWCLSNPEFVAVGYGPLLGKCYLGYPIRENAITFASFLNNWLKVKEQTGFQQKMVQYWIKGQPIETKKPRWSILDALLANFDLQDL